MKRFRWEPFAVAALFSLALTATVQAQTASIESRPVSASGYVFAPQPSGYFATPAYTTTLSQPYSGYSQPVYTYYASSPRRTYIQPGQGYNWESRTSYASYDRPATYSRGYATTQPYYYPGQGYGTMTQGVMPNGASYRAWQPPSRVR
jgi:hypothetical protein